MSPMIQRSAYIHHTLHPEADGLTKNDPKAISKETGDTDTQPTRCCVTVAIFD